MAKRPHVVLFNPDQWRSDVLGHMGNPGAVTPNLDRSVREDAVSFRNAFCQNTVCTPSRCSFMTGWYPHTHGHRTMYHMLRPHEPSVMQRLRAEGYRVWWGGKNDLFPGQNGWGDYCDVYFQASEADHARWGIQYNAPGHHSGGDWRGAPEGDNYYSFHRGKLESTIPEQEAFCDWDWQRVLGAVDAIRNHDGEQPLFLYIPIGYPHPPYCVEEPYFSMIDRDALPPRAPTPEDWSNKASILRGIYEGQGLQDWPEERWTELRAVYYGMCARVDAQWGMLVDALKEAGMYDDTALFLFSDHGDYTGDYGIVEKTQNTMEDCLSRVPFVVKPPKAYAAKPRVSDALVELVDFPATVYEWTGVEPGYSHFGKSLTDVVAGGAETHRDATFCEGGRLAGETHCMELESMSNNNAEGLYYPRLRLQTQDEVMYHTKAAMCRTERYKYIRRQYERDEFYDLQADPQETTNRIDDPACAAEVARHKERLLTWYMETCDTVPHDADQRIFKKG